jgi:hypothetical protein
LDECTGPAVAQWLGRQNHDVISVFDEIRGADYRDVIQKACEQDRILITNDILVEQEKEISSLKEAQE